MIIGRGLTRVQAQFHEACTLITHIGLRIAAHKVQPPAPAITWLSIRIDTVANEISIPPLKLDSIQRGLAAAGEEKPLTVRQLQSIIGHINHLSKAVASARLFMGSLLAALRSAHGPRVHVSPAVRAVWPGSRSSLKTYNGLAIIPHN